jgi:hypothetical protein
MMTNTSYSCLTKILIEAGKIAPWTGYYGRLSERFAGQPIYLVVDSHSGVSHNQSATLGTRGYLRHKVFTSVYSTEENPKTVESSHSFHCSKELWNAEGVISPEHQCYQEALKLLPIASGDLTRPSETVACPNSRTEFRLQSDRCYFWDKESQEFRPENNWAFWIFHEVLAVQVDQNHWSLFANAAFVSQERGDHRVWVGKYTEPDLDEKVRLFPNLPTARKFLKRQAKLGKINPY